jgi:hypothetical protein
MGFQMRQPNPKSKIFPPPPSPYVGRYSGGPALKGFTSDGYDFVFVLNEPNMK